MAEEENVEMIEQGPVEITDGVKRQASGREQVPESERAFAIMILV